jgi:hypothetical protein
MAFIPSKILYTPNSPDVFILFPDEGFFLQRRSSIGWAGRQSSAYSVEKLQIFPGGKFICDITSYKI